ncbi:MAG: T9SS type A sorting domain-containing protein, partial [Bacteroidota bacterium]
ANEQTMLDNIAAAVVKYQALITSIGDIGTSVNGFNLGQNSPNPFNNSTSISYQLPDAGLVSLKVFNVIGSEVASLVNSNQAKGLHTIQFTAAGLPGGVYYYTLRCGDQVTSKKMLLVK